VADHCALWQNLVARFARTCFEVWPGLDSNRYCFEGRTKRIGSSFDDGRFFRAAWAKAMVDVDGVG
jgi:hypothetical protein